MRNERPLTLTELADLEDPGDRWILPHMMQVCSRVLLYGPSNVGKSLVALDLAVAVASGTAFLGEAAPTRTGAVLVYSPEGDLYANRDRLLWIANAHDIGYDEPVHLAQRSLLLDDAADQQELDEVVAEINPLVLVLDPWVSFFYGEENSATATKPVHRYLNDLIERRGLTVVIVHHETAPSPQAPDVRGRPRGSTALYNWADTVIHLHEVSIKGVKGRRVTMLGLEVIKQRNGPKGSLIQVVPRIDPIGRLITFDADAPRPGAYLRAQILEYLHGKEAQTFTAIRDVVGGRTTTLRHALRDLEKEDALLGTNIAVAAGRGRFRWASAWRLRTPADDPVDDPTTQPNAGAA